ncbi:MAG: hypothetical protein LBQ12_14540 [Deltaproteobacteria bacterium]|nr:hypothetical protein [Deltaproteobacteria bacterium]
MTFHVWEALRPVKRPGGLVVAGQARTIATSGAHSLIIDNTGHVWSCGGLIDYPGLLGRVVSPGSEYGVNLGRIEELDNVVAVAAAWGDDDPLGLGVLSLFLKSDGTVYVCGCSDVGQTGIAGAEIYPSILLGQIPGLSDIVAIATSGMHSLFLKSDGTVLACGYNRNGQCGGASNYGPNLVVTPQPIDFPWDVSGSDLKEVKIAAISAGNKHSLFLGTNGKTYSCGINEYGQLAKPAASNWGSFNSYPGPTYLSPAYENYVGSSGLTKALSADIFNSLFLMEDGTAWAAGDNAYGQCGLVDTNLFSEVSLVSELSGVQAVESGSGASFFILSDGSVSSAGDHYDNQLGHNGANFSLAEVPGKVVEVSSNNYVTLFRTEDGKVWSCGQNGQGQLGRAAANGSLPGEVVLA